MAADEPTVEQQAAPAEAKQPDPPQASVSLAPITEVLGISAQHTELAEAGELARIFVASGFFADTKKLSQGIVKIYAGRELGLPPMAAMREIHIVEGKISLSANLVAALIRKNDRYKFRVLERTDRACELEFFERERRAGGTWSEWEPQGKVRFTIEDAKRANLVKDRGNWSKWPRAMCFARAITEGARAFCADVFEGGVYGDGEIEEARGGEPVLEVAEWGGTSKVIDATTGEVVATAYADDDEPEVVEGEVVTDDSVDVIVPEPAKPDKETVARIARLLPRTGVEDVGLLLYDCFGEAAPASVSGLSVGQQVTFVAFLEERVVVVARGKQKEGS